MARDEVDLVYTLSTLTSRALGRFQDCKVRLARQVIYSTWLVFRRKAILLIIPLCSMLISF